MGVRWAAEKMYDVMERHIDMQSTDRMMKKIYVCSDDYAREKCREHYTVIIQRVIWIMLISLVLTLAAALSGMKRGHEVKLKRPGYGQASGVKTIETDVNGRSENVNIEVYPTVYDEEGLRNAFEKTEAYLDSVYLGQNESPDKVQDDLNLVDYQEEYGIDIEWLSSDYSVVTGEGKVMNSDADIDKVVELTAVLTYGDERVERKYPVRVIGRKLSASELAEKTISDYVKRLQDERGAEETIVLPAVIEGYSVRNPDSGSSWAAILMAGLALAVCAFAGGRSKLKNMANARKDELMYAYPEFVENLSLYLRAGLTVRGAVSRIAEEQSEGSLLQKEIKYTLNEISAGVPESEAYYHMGHRTDIPLYIKTMSLLSQNVKKGTRDLLAMMEGEEQSAAQARRDIAKKKGEEAGTKLLFPMMILLGVVMLIVIVPAVMSF